MKTSVVSGAKLGGVGSGVTREVGRREILALDFNNVSLKLGVQTPACEGRWMELDETDLRVLYALLTKDVAGAGSAVESSPSLNALAAFCASAVQWYARQRQACVDDRQRG